MEIETTMPTNEVLLGRPAVSKPSVQLPPAMEIGTASNTIETLNTHFHTAKCTAGCKIIAIHINHTMYMQHRADAH
jgi:hypothetical protein